MALRNEYIEINNCIFSENYSPYYGGAILLLEN